MNYLAHLYLSDDVPKIMIGNFIADSVKGTTYTQYDSYIQYGIKMHRFIDRYTDEHPLTSETKHLLYPTCGKYAGAVLDIINDHFIAKQWSEIHQTSLHDFTMQFYALLEKHLEILPTRVQHMLPYMKKSNWILNYGSVDGIHDTLFNLGKRIKENPGIENATDVLVNKYSDFLKHYEYFWPELCMEVEEWKKQNSI